MEFLFSRPVVIGFAVAGGFVSLVAMLLRNRQRTVAAARADSVSYVLMATSMVLFIVAGLRSQH